MKSFFPYIFGALIFLFAIVLTDPVFWADSADYVDSVVAFQQNQNYNFWEFGHLFWRPLGWFFWSHIFSSGEGNFWRSEINSTFQTFSYIAGFVATLALAGTLKNLKLPAWIVAVATAGFVFSHAFLNFTQTGTSYITALMFYTLGLFFSLRETEEMNWVNPILSGIFLALTLCFWMPFLWTIPAVIVAPFVLYDFRKQRFIEAAFKIAAFSLIIALSYGIVLSVLQIYSLSELKSWITESSHGNETRGLMRMIFGLARSFVNMGSDGILFKRFLLKDAFNPVSIIDLISGSLWKVALFYGLVGCVLLSLLRNPRGRKFFVVLLTAALPMLVFATLFDGGAVERYLPLFPVAFISLAIALQIEGWKFLRYAMLAILAIFAAVNISVLSVWSVAEQQNKFVSRLELLEAKAQPKDKIFVVNWTDDLINFNRSFPFNPINLRREFKLNSIVTPGSTQTTQWREEFAARSFLAWANGENVWLSNRAFVEQPKADWNWAEGDDKNVGWREFPEFFSRLELGERLGDENGFTMILPSEANKKFLQEYKDKFTGEIKNTQNPANEK
jgi:hypothetical protein